MEGAFDLSKRILSGVLVWRLVKGLVYWFFFIGKGSV